MDKRMLCSNRSVDPGNLATLSTRIRLSQLSASLQTSESQLRQLGNSYILTSRQKAWHITLLRYSEENRGYHGNLKAILTGGSFYRAVN